MNNLYNLEVNVFSMDSGYYLIEPNKCYTFNDKDLDTFEKTENKYKKFFQVLGYSNFNGFELTIFHKNNKPYRIDLFIDNYTKGFEFNYIYDDEKISNNINREIIKILNKLKYIKIIKTDFIDYKDHRDNFYRERNTYLKEIKNKERLKDLYITLYENLVEEFINDKSIKNRDYRVECESSDKYYFDNLYFSIRISNFSIIEIYPKFNNISNIGDYVLFSKINNIIDNIIKNKLVSSKKYKFNVKFTEENSKDILIIDSDCMKYKGLDYKKYNDLKNLI